LKNSKNEFKIQVEKYNLIKIGKSFAWRVVRIKLQVRLLMWFLSNGRERCFIMS